MKDRVGRIDGHKFPLLCLVALALHCGSSSAIAGSPEGCDDDCKLTPDPPPSLEINISRDFVMEKDVAALSKVCPDKKELASSMPRTNVPTTGSATRLGRVSLTNRVRKSR
jgi:hypothetical protein